MPNNQYWLPACCRTTGYNIGCVKYYILNEFWHVNIIILSENLRGKHVRLMLPNEYLALLSCSILSFCFIFGLPYLSNAHEIKTEFVGDDFHKLGVIRIMA